MPALCVHGPLIFFSTLFSTSIKHTQNVTNLYQQSGTSILEWEMGVCVALSVAVHVGGHSMVVAIANNDEKGTDDQ
jgi:hypothetical protein